MHFFTQDFRTPYGELSLGTLNGQLVLCDWKYRKMRSAIDKRITEGLGKGNQLHNEETQENTAVIKAAIYQLEEYFEGKRQQFDLPIKTIGTEFQQQVWCELQKIPYGKTESYLELSRKLGNEKAIRAVASANGANAHSIIIPCHRVVGSNGELTGYAGGLTTKKKLLEFENPARKSQLNLF